MKKFIVIALSLFFISGSLIFYHASNPKVAATYAQTYNNDYNELSITLLHPHIEKAIENYYGYNRRYEIGDSQLVILKRKGNVFDIKVTVDTFEGAHNDYYTEILTFTVTPFSVTLNEYIHGEFIKN